MDRWSKKHPTNTGDHFLSPTACQLFFYLNHYPDRSLTLALLISLYDNEGSLTFTKTYFSPNYDVFPNVPMFYEPKPNLNCGVVTYLLFSSDL